MLQKILHNFKNNFSNHSSLEQKWALIEIKINKYLNNIFQKNPLLDPGNYYFWKKNKLYLKIEIIESFNFYLKKHEVIVEQKPVFANYDGYLVIDYQNQEVFFKTQSYQTKIKINNLIFLKRDHHIESEGYDTFKHSIHLTNIFITDNAVFKFLSIEPIKIAIILNIIMRILKAKSLSLYKINNFLKIRG